MLQSKPEPIISEDFKGVIWKILLDNDQSLIAVESRNVDNKEVGFSVINYITGEILFKERVFEERWLLNLLHIGNGNIYLSLFAGESKMFQSSGIIAIDIQTRKVKWQNFTISFWETLLQGIKVYNTTITPKKFFFLDYNSGNEIRVDYPAPAASYIVMPQLTDDNITVEANIGDKSIRCYHDKTAGGYQIRLTVTQHDSLIIDDILMQGIQKLQPETFFLQLNSLFYIRNQNQLVSYLL